MKLRFLPAAADITAAVICHAPLAAAIVVIVIVIVVAEVLVPPGDVYGDLPRADPLEDGDRLGVREAVS